MLSDESFVSLKTVTHSIQKVSFTGSTKSSLIFRLKAVYFCIYTYSVNNIQQVDSGKTKGNKEDTVCPATQWYARTFDNTLTQSSILASALSGGICERVWVSAELAFTAATVQGKG